VIGADPVNVPALSWLGVFPTWQTLGAQALALVIAGFAFTGRPARGRPA
jgi:hypothetical protein